MRRVYAESAILSRLSNSIGLQTLPTCSTPPRPRGVERIVLISSADASLHRGARVNWNEFRAPAQERVHGHFAKSVRLAEEFTLGFSVRGLETTALRPAMLWGRGMPDPRCQCEQQNKRGIQLIGQGNNYIGTTHIDSLVSSVLSAAESSQAVGRSYYIADDDMISAKVFYQGLSQKLSLPAPQSGPRFLLAYANAWMEERRQGPGLWRGDIIRRGAPTIFDTLAARRDLDWEPAHTFEEGLRKLQT